MGVEWYAACDGILKMGPYETEVEAWEALCVVPEEQPYWERVAGVPALPKRIHVKGAYVWPERKR